MCIISAFFEFSGSIGINELLKYLETNGEGAKLKPIVWVVLLFVGPLFNSLAIQHYIFLMTRALVRTECLLTQLLFDHALRLRMRDSTEGEDEKAAEPEASGPVINVEEVTADGVEAVIPENGQGLTTGEAVAVGVPAPEEGASKKEEAEDSGPKGQGLAGKINVLMAADVESVVEGRDIPLVLIYTPFQFILCVVFLYRILSWSEWR